jgi:hypothetical protein
MSISGVLRGERRRRHDADRWIKEEANQWGKRVNGKSVDGRGVNVKAVSFYIAIH